MRIIVYARFYANVDMTLFAAHLRVCESVTECINFEFEITPTPRVFGGLSVVNALPGEIDRSRNGQTRDYSDKLHYYIGE